MTQQATFPSFLITNLPRDTEHTELITIPKKMTKNRIQIPFLDKMGINAKRFYDYRRGLERFKQYAKTDYDTDIGQPIREKTTSETEWAKKQENVQTNFLSIGTRSNTSSNTIEILNRTGENRNRQTNQIK